MAKKFESYLYRVGSPQIKSRANVQLSVLTLRFCTGALGSPAFALDSKNIGCSSLLWKTKKGLEGFGISWSSYGFGVVGLYFKRWGIVGSSGLKIFPFNPGFSPWSFPGVSWFFPFLIFSTAVNFFRIFIFLFLEGWGYLRFWSAEWYGLVISFFRRDVAGWSLRSCGTWSRSFC